MNFPLKKEWFEKIKSGEKACEYRVNSKYWATRANNMNIGDTITFSLGYSKNILYKKLVAINLISEERLWRKDFEAWSFMVKQNKSHCLMLEFEFCDLSN